MRIRGKLLLFLVLLALPLAGRLAWFYRGWYSSPAIPATDESEIAAAGSVHQRFQDQPAEGKGRIVIDLSHASRLEINDLDPLRDRLQARGATIETFYGTNGSLKAHLRDATALVVIAPGTVFADADDLEPIVDFVEDGGRLLLAADPTRPTQEADIGFDENGPYLIPRISGVIATNSLANAFGVSYFDDHMYNIEDHEGSYRNVRFTAFGGDHPLTEGLETVVLFAPHSLRSNGLSLIVGDEDTRSAMRTGETGLTAATLTADGRVLALGDVTFMTVPYHTVGDNDRFLSNIADWLVVDERRRDDLEDFPYFFGDQVDLVSLSTGPEGSAFSVEAVEENAELQSAFEAAGRTLHWRTKPVAGHDIFYLGLYDDLRLWPQVDEILSSEGISFTLETAEKKRAALTPTPTPRYTPALTPVPEASPTPTSTPKPLRDWIHLAGVGPVEAQKVALFYQKELDGRQVLIALAYSEQGLFAATDRLLSGDFNKCLMDKDRGVDPGSADLVLCRTTYEPLEEDPTLPPTPPPEVGPAPPPPAPEAAVLIVSDDHGNEMYGGATSALDFLGIAQEAGYDAVLRSTSDGEVTLEELQAYTAVIWCTGDYQEQGGTPADQEIGALGEYLYMGGRVILVGAFLGSSDDGESGQLLDIQVKQGEHPVARGFDADQIVDLKPSNGGQAFAPFTLGDRYPGEIIFARGPKSELSETAVVVAAGVGESGGKALTVGLPIYLLSDEDAMRLGTNMIEWITGE